MSHDGPLTASEKSGVVVAVVVLGVVLLLGSLAWRGCTALLDRQTEKDCTTYGAKVEAQTATSTETDWWFWNCAQD